MCHKTLWSERFTDDSSYRLCAVRPYGLGDVVSFPPVSCVVRHCGSRRCTINSSYRLCDVRPCGPGDVLSIPPIGLSSNTVV